MQTKQLLMTITHKVNLLHALGSDILEHSDHWEEVITLAYQSNPWFTPEHIRQAMEAIALKMLNHDKLNQWISNYTLDGIAPKSVGIIMAGNIPLVGFADWLAVFITGHIAKVKLSEKDSVLFKAIFGYLVSLDDSVLASTLIVDQLKDYDAVIATGSNNTALHFEYYFRNVPHLIRKSRTSVAVLSGKETPNDLQELGHDLFDYFGLGCRNVSKIWVPRNYQIANILDQLDAYQSIVHHNKYRNNYDYNSSLYLLNQVPFLTNDFVIFKEDKDLFSRIGCIHYEYYDDLEEVVDSIQEHKHEIQCIVSALDLKGINCVGFGQPQKPELWDYADDIDTMEFLTQKVI